MLGKGHRIVSHLLGLVFGVALVCGSGMIHGQKKALKPRTNSGGNTCKLYKIRPGIEIESPVSLQLKNCTFREPVNFPLINFEASMLEVDGNSITLISPSGEKRSPGEIIAYATSHYCISANVGLVFDRVNLPVTDKDWQPPKILSLELVQESLNEFRLFSPPGAPAPFNSTTFTCQETDITPAVK